MNKLYYPDFVGKSGRAVVILVSSLDDELSGVIDRFHRGEQVAYRFEWHLKKNEEGKYLVVFFMEFNTGEKLSIPLYPYHWDCLPAIISLGFLVLMTDSDILNKESLITDENIPEPRALVIENAFWGLNEMVNQIGKEIQTQQSEELDLLLKLLDIKPEDIKKQRH